MILCLRTDKPEAELHLLKEGQECDRMLWYAHRELSDTLLSALEELLARNEVEKTDLTGIISFTGPGSFTGLRIGVTVANTLAYSLSIPHVGSDGDGWVQAGLQRVTQANNSRIITPRYGSEARITQPRK